MAKRQLLAESSAETNQRRKELKFAFDNEKLARKVEKSEYFTNFKKQVESAKKVDSFSILDML